MLLYRVEEAVPFFSRMSFCYVQLGEVTHSFAVLEVR